MNPRPLQVLLAALPLLGSSLEAKSGLFNGGVTFGSLLSSLFLFFPLQRVIPKRLHRISFLLLLLMLGVLWGELFLIGVSLRVPLHLVSLFLLTPPGLFSRQANWRRRGREVLLAGLFFWGVVAGHGIVSEWFNWKLGMEFFGAPAGSYFLMGLTALFLIKK